MIEVCFEDTVYSELLRRYGTGSGDLEVTDVRGLYSDEGKYRCVVTALLSEQAIEQVILRTEDDI